MSCVLVLLMAIGMMLVVVDLSPVGCLYPSFYIHMGRGYKEGNQVGSCAGVWRAKSAMYLV
jgi:hypothetical protein